ncbi:MAG: hypothetical protein Kow0090_22040 [Myxococcota bacterium]
MTKGFQEGDYYISPFILTHQCIKAENKESETVNFFTDESDDKSLVMATSPKKEGNKYFLIGYDPYLEKPIGKTNSAFSTSICNHADNASCFGVLFIHNPPETGYLHDGWVESGSLTMNFLEPEEGKWYGIVEVEYADFEIPMENGEINYLSGKTKTWYVIDFTYCPEDNEFIQNEAFKSGASIPEVTDEDKKACGIPLTEEEYNSQPDKSETVCEGNICRSVSY